MPSNFGGLGSYSAAAGILDGINGIFDRRREDAEIERQRKMQERQMALGEDIKRLGMVRDRADLAARGVREGAMPSAPSIALPLGAVGGINTSIPDVGRYQGMGDGFYQDRDATPEFRAQQDARRATDARQSLSRDMITMVGQALGTNNPAETLRTLMSAGYSPADAKTIMETARGPEERAPIPGTPKDLTRIENEERIKAKFRPAPRAPQGRELPTRAEYTAANWKNFVPIKTFGQVTGERPSDDAERMAGEQYDRLYGGDGAPRGGARGGAPVEREASGDEIDSAIREAKGDVAKAEAILRRRGLK